MSVGLFIITHNEIGRQLLDTAIAMLDACPLHALTLEVHADSDLDTLMRQAREAAQQLDDGHGLLVLTDVYGSTPSNIANSLQENREARVISGVNLPMLVRILNYPHLGLDELTDKAISGGTDGILLCNQMQSRQA